jgi:mannose-6-phosphate isomerase-like protein (cupin superfamily)
MAEQPGKNAYRPGDRDTRPWGTWEVLAVGPTYCAKRIVVFPGQRLSLQRHRGRHEHWVVVEGEALVTLDASVRPLAENQGVEIPVGTAHRLENPGDKPLCVIEVQYGQDLREDDIERLDDQYGRV